MSRIRSAWTWHKARKAEAITLWLIFFVVILTSGLTYLMAPSPLYGTFNWAYPNRTIVLDMDLVNVDTTANKLTMACNIIGDFCAGDFDNEGVFQYFNDSVIRACEPVTVYFDLGLLAGTFDGTSNRPWTSADPTTSEGSNIPNISWSPEIYLDNRHNTPAFSIDLSVRSSFKFEKVVNKLGIAHSTVSYPFDEYSAEAFFFGVGNSTNTPVSVAAITRGIAFGYSVHIVNQTDSPIPDPNLDGTTYIQFSIRRATLVKAYVIVLLLAMWLTNLILSFIAIRAAFFGYKVDTGVLVVPVATLFAFTALRGSMPGAPSFGAYIDFIGTLPTLACLVSVSFICLWSVFVRMGRSESASHPARRSVALDRGDYEAVGNRKLARADSEEHDLKLLDRKSMDTFISTA